MEAETHSEEMTAALEVVETGKAQVRVVVEMPGALGHHQRLLPAAVVIQAGELLLEEGQTQAGVLLQRLLRQYQVEMEAGVRHQALLPHQEMEAAGVLLPLRKLRTAQLVDGVTQAVAVGDKPKTSSLSNCRFKMKE